MTLGLLSPLEMLVDKDATLETVIFVVTRRCLTG